MLLNISEVLTALFNQASRYIMMWGSSLGLVIVMHPHLMSLIEYFLPVISLSLLVRHLLHHDWLTWTGFMHRFESRSALLGGV
jgi:hypothetical protein